MVSASRTLVVEIAGIEFSHPVLAAPGPLGFGREVQAVTDLRAFGGFITKSVTVEPRVGNPRPQIARTDAGWLNSVGLQNAGLAVFLSRDLPFLRTLGIPIIVSMAGESTEEFVSLAEWLSGEPGIAALEANISCPNVATGMTYGSDPSLTHDLVAALKRATPLPLFVKLTPNVTDIVAIARAAEDAGADALSMVNAFLAMAIDVETRRPRVGGVTGGLSGPAIRPIAVRMTWQVARACRVPIIGMGGVGTGEHAIEFILAGATAVAIGSAAIDDADVAAKVRDEIAAYLDRHGVPRVADLRGALDLSLIHGSDRVLRAPADA